MSSTRTRPDPLPTSTGAREPLPRAVWVLAAGTFLMGTTEFVVAGLLPEVAGDFATTQAHAGLAITVFAVGMIIGAPTLPLLALRLPRRVTLALALGLFAVAHVVSATTGSFAVLLVSRFAAALATGTFWALAAVVAAGLVGPARSSSALGIVLGGGMLANVVGVPIGSFGGQLVGWRGPFWALGALAVVAAVAVVRLVPAGSSGPGGPGGPGAAEVASVRSELASLRSLPLWLALVTCAAVTAGVLSVYSFVSPLLTGRTGLDVGLVPVALVLFGAGALAGSVIGGRLGDARPLRTVAVTATVTLVAMVALWPASSVPVAALAAFALLGVVGLSANPVLVALVNRCGGAGATLPSAMATSMFNLGTAIGTAVTGAALGTSLGELAPLAVGTTAAALTLVPLTALVLVERRSGAQERRPG